MPLTANPDQKHAIEQVLKYRNQYQAFLLDGLTGSGKTEVYLQIMERGTKTGQTGVGASAGNRSDAANHQPFSVPFSLPYCAATLRFK